VARLMSNRHRWDWEAHLTPEETAELAALWREDEQIRNRLDEIKLAEEGIRKVATGRAKAARSVRKPLVL
jgi:hypothetical protein